MEAGRDLDRSNCSEERAELKREFGLIGAVNLVLNIILGPAIFITPGVVLAESGSVGMSLLVWFICGIISVLGTLAFAELSTVIPKSGGSYAFFQAAFKDMHPYFGPLAGFTFIWVLVIIVMPTTLAVTVIVQVDYIYETFRPVLSSDFNSNYENLIKTSIGAISLVIIGVINCLSVKLYLKYQNVMSYLKLFGCAYVVVGGIYMVVSGKEITTDFGFKGTKLTLQSLVTAFYGGLYSYDGWSWICGVAEEIKNPEKDVIRSSLLSVFIVTVLYVGMNAAFLTALSVDEIINGTAVGIQFGDRVFGPGKIVISLAIIITCIGANLSYMFYASRLGYVAAREGQMWEFLCCIHKTRLTPTPAIILQVILSLIYFFIGNGVQIFINFYVFLLWISYGLAMVSVFVLRKKMPLANRPYKVPVWIPVVVLLISVCLTFIPLFTEPIMQYVLCLIMVGIGVIFYTLFIYLHIKIPGLDRFQSVLQEWMDVVSAVQESKT